MHTLPVRNPEVLEAWAFGDLEEINLHFILLVERTVRETTDVAVHDVEAPRPKTPWRLPESIFKPRLRESDSKGFFDTHQIEDRNFEKNWKRVTGKDKFLSFLERESRTNKEKDAKQVEREIHSILRQHYMIISSIFAYYAVTGGGSPFTMELNDFTSLLEICNVPDKESELCKKSDCDTVFIQCNFVVSITPGRPRPPHPSLRRNWNPFRRLHATVAIDIVTTRPCKARRRTRTLWRQRWRRSTRCFGTSSSRHSCASPGSSTARDRPRRIFPRL